jgi:DNA protecting protein DprA
MTSKMEIQRDDLLGPAPPQDVPSYIPRAPGKMINGKVLAMYDGVNFGGPQTVVTLNRGAADGLEVGHVLAVDAAGQLVTNRYQDTRTDYQLPDTRNGLLFVFRVFGRVSYAMVMSASSSGGSRRRSAHPLIPFAAAAAPPVTPQPGGSPMNDRGELASWLRLTLTPGIGNAARRALLNNCGLPQAIFDASLPTLSAIIEPALAERLLRHECRAEIEAALDWAGQPGNHLLTLADADYPQSLLSSDDPPLLLYAKGNTAVLNRPMLAVVGSRNATAQGLRDAEAFARALGEAGLTIVSGLALGIDAAAHRGALATLAGTVAVIGTGADRLYPARNEALAREIADKGVVLSEFPLGTPALGANFPRRNRIIAGLGLGCLVVEAALRSGSLITARLAAESGPRGVCHSGLHPFAPVARLPSVDSTGGEAGGIGRGHPRGIALGHSRCRHRR